MIERAPHAKIMALQMQGWGKSVDLEKPPDQPSPREKPGLFPPDSPLILSVPVADLGDISLHLHQVASKLTARHVAVRQIFCDLQGAAADLRTMTG